MQPIRVMAQNLSLRFHPRELLAPKIELLKTLETEHLGLRNQAKAVPVKVKTVVVRTLRSRIP
jgi:hypothetical protein